MALLSSPHPFLPQPRSQKFKKLSLILSIVAGFSSKSLWNVSFNYCWSRLPMIYSAIMMCTTRFLPHNCFAWWVFSTKVINSLGRSTRTRNCGLACGKSVSYKEAWSSHLVLTWCCRFHETPSKFVEARVKQCSYTRACLVTHVSWLAPWAPSSPATNCWATSAVRFISLTREGQFVHYLTVWVLVSFATSTS